MTMLSDKTPLCLLATRRRSSAAILLLGVTFIISNAPMASAVSRSTPVPVVAAENFWGGIAAQIGGRNVAVTSIITNPNTDPHEYEPTANDARAIAAAHLVIENGIGYDPWAQKLLAADGSGATVLNVGTVLNLAKDANPHRWYNPTDVSTVVKTIARDLSTIDPSAAGTFMKNASVFEDHTLSTYHSLISTIRHRFAGTRVGASESIFAMLSPALGLNLVTPPTFLRAISEGSDVSASDKATIDRQIARHAIAIYVFNSQNATPDIASQIAACRRSGIPTATITETLAPAIASYQSWQVAQLRGILAALERAHTP